MSMAVLANVGAIGMTECWVWGLKGKGWVRLKRMWPDAKGNFAASLSPAMLKRYTKLSVGTRTYYAPVYAGPGIGVVL